ncbi:MAG: hypothetical protein HY934_00490 [Candidatus Firestonebacteria bacterium]|nr:hypothetical protein [Candidatus Firestonebacteria bacterium]
MFRRISILIFIFSLFTLITVITSCSKILRENILTPNIFDTKEPCPTFLAFSQDNRYLAVTNTNDHINIYDVRTGKKIINFTAGQNGVKHTKWSSDATLFLSLGSDGTVNIWDTKEWKLKITLESHMKSALFADFLSEKNLLAIGTMDRSIIIWDTQKWSIIHSIENLNGFVNQIYFTQDGQRLYAITSQGNIQAWEIDGWKLINRLYLPNFSVSQIAVHPTNIWAVIVINNNSLSVLDTNPKRNIWDYVYSLTHIFNDKITKIIFSADGSTFISLSNNGILFWDTKKWKSFASLHSQKGMFTSVAISNDNNIIAYATDSGIVNIEKLEKIKMNNIVSLK